MTQTVIYVTWDRFPRKFSRRQKACHAISNAQNGNCIKEYNNEVWNSSLNNEQMDLSKLNIAHAALKRAPSASKYTQSNFTERQNNWGRKGPLEAV